MNKNVECKHYRISQVEFDFEKLAKGKQNIKVEVQISIKTPDEMRENKKNIVEIIPTFLINDQVEILKAKIQGQFEIVEERLTKDQIEQILEQEAVPFLYVKLQEYINEVLKLSNINFTSLPPYVENEEE